MDKDNLKQRLWMSTLVKSIKDSFKESINELKGTLKVEVSNPDTNLLKEVAKNTRGLKERIDNIKLNLTQNIPSNLKIDIKEVFVKNTVQTRITNLEDMPKVVIPKEVSISNLKDLPEPLKEIRISNLSDIKPQKQEKADYSSLEKRLDGVKTAVNSVSSLLPGLKPKDFPKFTFPKEMSMKEGQDIEKSIKQMEKTISDDLVALAQVIKEQESGMGSNERGEIEVKVKNFPPTSIPTPVTNFNLNSLRGLPLSTVTQAGTTAVTLPATALVQRRSLIVFNNSGNTVYLGGAGVTTATGLPLLDQSYSPPIDAGEHMKIYAIAGSSSNELRVFEVSNDSEGN